MGGLAHELSTHEREVAFGQETPKAAFVRFSDAVAIMIQWVQTIIQR
jgi:hypothetical protein